MAIVNPEVITGALLKELIKKSKVSITDVADKLDKTRSGFLATLKCSNAKPSDDEVSAILDFIGVSREEFDFQKRMISAQLEDTYEVKVQLQGSMVDGNQRLRVRNLVQEIYIRHQPGYRSRAMSYQPVC